MRDCEANYPDTLEQGQAYRREAVVQTEPCLVYSDELQMQGKTPDLQLAIDSNLRGSNVVSIRADDVAPTDH